MRADLDLVFEKKNVGHTETSKTLLRMMAGVEGGGGSGREMVHQITQ